MITKSPKMAAKMNKQDEVHAEVTELEKELIGNSADNEKLEGRREVKTNNKFEKQMQHTNRQLAIKQGLRFRHPKRTLGNFLTIQTTTKHADKAWEKALLEETERQEVDRIYRSDGTDMLANQLGLHRVAEGNFRKIKPKLGIFTLLGV